MLWYTFSTNTNQVNSMHTQPTHVCVTVIRLGGVFGAAIEETIGGRFCHSIGEVVNFHVHVVTEGKDGETVSVWHNSQKVVNLQETKLQIKTASWKQMI